MLRGVLRAGRVADGREPDSDRQLDRELHAGVPADAAGQETDRGEDKERGAEGRETLERSAEGVAEAGAVAAVL